MVPDEVRAVRRYQPMRQSRGTTIPIDVRDAVLRRDNYRCVCQRAGFPNPCFGGSTELDHVRASHGMGMKSESTERNLVTLASGCHRWKTEHGRAARALLLAYIASTVVA